MKLRLCLLFFVFAGWLGSLPVAAGGRGDYVLIVNSYNEINAWSYAVANGIRSEVQSVRDIPFYVESLNAGVADDPENWKVKMKLLFSDYGQLPRVVVLIGNEAWITYRKTVPGRWREIPLVLCGVFPQFVDFDTFRTTGSVDPQQLLTTEAEAREFPATGVFEPLEIGETVSLMQRLLPRMDSLLFVSGSSYAGIYSRAVAQETLSRSFPGLPVVYVDGRALSGRTMLERLKGAASRTGVLMHTWFRGSDNEIFSTDLCRKLNGELRTPIFLLKDLVLEGTCWIGGVFALWPSYANETSRMVVRILQGADPRAIPFVEDPGLAIRLDYPALNHFGMAPDTWPPEAELRRQPPSFREKYAAFWPLLIGLVWGFLALIAGVLLFSWLRNRKLRRYYQDLFDNMPIAYLQNRVQRDASGTICGYEILQNNPFCEETFGVRPKDVVADISSNRSQRENLERLMRHPGEVIRSVYFHVPLRRYYEVTVYSRRSEEFVVFMTDITHQKEQEQENEKLRELFRYASSVSDIGVASIDLQTHEVFASSEWFCNLGEDPKADIETVIRHYNAVHPEDRRVLIDFIDRACRARVDPLSVDIRVRNDAGEWRWVKQNMMQRTFDPEDRRIEVVELNIDIDRQKQIEEELRTAKLRAETSDRLKSAFLANMSHEIRTPLNAIVGFSALLAESDDPDERCSYRRIIENNNAHLLQLIGDILDLAKIESGSFDYTCTEVDVRHLLEELCQVSWQRSERASDVKIVCRAEGACGVVRMPQMRVVQVLTNLVTNALKFTERGSVTLGCERQTAALRFFVSDTGRGIPLSEQKRIFERFVKLDSFVPGTGLGLSICKGIVERLGGEIGVESEEGRGSTFWFTVPFWDEAASDGSGGISEADPEAEEEKKVGRKRILIAEDNPDNYKLYESVLGGEYELIHAWNGEEAVAFFREQAPDLVLMDIKMPKMDGYEALAAIRTLSATAPVLAVTAFAFPEDEERIRRCGFSGMLTKPIHAADLKTQVRQWLA